jgi:hypothetical protein
MASFNACPSHGWRDLSAGGPALSRYSTCMPPSVITPSGQSLAAASPRGRCHSLLGHEAGIGGAGPQPRPQVDTDPGEAVDLIGVSNIPEELSYAKDAALPPRPPPPALLRCAFPERRRSVIRMSAWFRWRARGRRMRYGACGRRGHRWRCHSGRGAGSAEGVTGGEDPRPAVALQAPHRPEPGLQPPVVCLDRVVRVLLDGVQRRGD